MNVFSRNLCTWSSIRYRIPLLSRPGHSIGCCYSQTLSTNHQTAAPGAGAAIQKPPTNVNPLIPRPFKTSTQGITPTSTGEREHNGCRKCQHRQVAPLQLPGRGSAHIKRVPGMPRQEGQMLGSATLQILCEARLEMCLQHGGQAQDVFHLVSWALLVVGFLVAGTPTSLIADCVSSRQIRELQGRVAFYEQQQSRDALSPPSSTVTGNVSAGQLQDKEGAAPSGDGQGLSPTERTPGAESRGHGSGPLPAVSPGLQCLQMDVPGGVGVVASRQSRGKQSLYTDS